MRKTGRDSFKKYSFIINGLIFLFGILPKNMNFYLLKIFRNLNGKTGLLIRYVLIKNLSKKCGKNVSVQPGVFIFNLSQIEFGDNISIHPMCYIDGAGGVDIGDNVSIAHNTSIMSSSHTWDDTETPIKYNREKTGKVSISDDVWIGCGVRILEGVTIKNRTIIAAGAVVNKSFESKTIIGGVPAKVLKRINEK